MAEQTRGTGFPRITLASAVQIITAAAKFGKSWKKEQFAGFGAKNNAASAKSGAFAARVSALKEYGLVVGDKDTLTGTELSQRVAKPINPQERDTAIKKAFLSVTTFGDLYRSFESDIALEKHKVAEHAVYNLGVSRDSKEKFVSMFIDSGKYAGLVSYDKDHDTVTLIPAGDTQTVELANEQPPEGSTPPTPAAVSEPLQYAIRPIANSDGGSSLNEQGVSHAGNDWSLTVLIKSGHRLPADLRKAIRNLLESADTVADQFYELEHKGDSHNE
jgi:hypothetical protein